MIVCDLVRAVVCVAFLFVGPETIWLAYVLLPVLATFAAPFDPALSAATPNVVDPQDLPAANALNGSLWGTMLAVGAGLGGLISAVFGADTAFLVDAGLLPRVGGAALLDPAELLRVTGGDDRTPGHRRGHPGDLALRPPRPPRPVPPRREVRVRGCRGSARPDPRDGHRRVRLGQHRLRHPDGRARRRRADRPVPRAPHRRTGASSALPRDRALARRVRARLHRAWDKPPRSRSPP